jgi:hypothetical protein
MKILYGAVAAAALLAAAVPAGAHHSYSMFDSTKNMQLSGVVQAFGWTNPHSYIEIVASNAKGVPEKWGVECTSPAVLARAGWRSSTLKAGDQVTITIHPLRSGELGGSFVSVQLPDGRLLTDKAVS